MRNHMIYSISSTISLWWMRELIVSEEWTPLVQTAQMRQSSGFWTRISARLTWNLWFKWPSKESGVLMIDLCLSIIFWCRRESQRLLMSLRKSRLKILMIDAEMLRYSMTISRLTWTSLSVERQAHLNSKTPEVLLASIQTTLCFSKIINCNIFV